MSRYLATTSALALTAALGILATPAMAAPAGLSAAPPPTFQCSAGQVINQLNGSGNPGCVTPAGAGGSAGIDYFGGTTSHSGNTYSATITGFSLADGVRVRAIPDAKSTATAFVNFSSSGAIQTYRQNASGSFVTTGPGDITTTITDFTYLASVPGVGSPGWVITSVPLSALVIVTGDITVDAGAFANGAVLYKVTSNATLTFPASASLANKGLGYVWAYGATATLASSGGDSINITSAKNGQLAMVDSNGVNALSVQLSGTPNGSGIVYHDSSSTTANSGTLTANCPVIGGGTNGAPACGTSSGNTTKFATVSGSLTNGNLTKADASGNIVDAGAAPGAGGGGDTQAAIASTWYAIEKGTLASGGATTASRCFARPFTFSTARTIDAVAVRPSTIGSTNVQIALYANNASTNRPTSTPLCSTSGTANNTGTPASQACSTGSLTPNLIYWAETNTNDSTAAYSNISSANSNVAWLIGSATLGNVSAGSTSTITNLNASCTYGTWGDQTSTSWTEGTSNNWAEVFTHLSSVP